MKLKHVQDFFAVAADLVDADGNVYKLDDLQGGEVLKIRMRKGVRFHGDETKMLAFLHRLKPATHFEF